MHNIFQLRKIFLVPEELLQTTCLTQLTSDQAQVDTNSGRFTFDLYSRRKGICSNALLHPYIWLSSLCGNAVEIFLKGHQRR